MIINGAMMSDQEIIKVVNAHNRGEAIEVRSYNEGVYYWQLKEDPSWNFGTYKYRPAKKSGCSSISNTSSCSSNTSSCSNDSTFLQKLWRKEMPKIHDQSVVMCLLDKGLISKEKAIKLLDIPNRQYLFKFNNYVCFFEKQLIDKTSLLLYIKDMDITDAEYLYLHELSVITKEELLEALRIS